MSFVDSQRKEGIDETDLLHSDDLGSRQVRASDKGEGFTN